MKLSRWIQRADRPSKGYSTRIAPVDRGAQSTSTFSIFSLAGQTRDEFAFEAPQGTPPGSDWR